MPYHSETNSELPSVLKVIGAVFDAVTTKLGSTGQVRYDDVGFFFGVTGRINSDMKGLYHTGEPYSQALLMTLAMGVGPAPESG